MDATGHRSFWKGSTVLTAWLRFLVKNHSSPCSPSCYSKPRKRNEGGQGTLKVPSFPPISSALAFDSLRSSSPGFGISFAWKASCNKWLAKACRKILDSVCSLLKSPLSLRHLVHLIYSSISLVNDANVKWHNVDVVVYLACLPVCLCVCLFAHV